MISLHLLLHTYTYTHILTAARPGRRCGPSSSILRTLLQLHPRSPSSPNSHVSCPSLPPRVIQSKIRLLSQLLNQSTNPSSAARCQLNTNYIARRNTYLKDGRLFLMLSDPPSIPTPFLALTSTLLILVPPSPSWI